MSERSGTAGPGAAVDPALARALKRAAVAGGSGVVPEVAGRVIARGARRRRMRAAGAAAVVGALAVSGALTALSLRGPEPGVPAVVPAATPAVSPPRPLPTASATRPAAERATGAPKWSSPSAATGMPAGGTPPPATPTRPPAPSP